MPERHDFEVQRSEIAFFMEKAFQISFVYFAGVAAFFAVSKSDVMASIVRATGVPLAGLAAVVILLLNLVYVTLACACLFAVLKRGLFILTHTSKSPSDRAARESIYWKWEEFVRSDDAKGAARMRDIAWNIDNYYMVPLFSVIVVASVISVVVAMESGSAIIQGVSSALIALHAIPGYILRQLAVLDRQCREILQAERGS
ncbi:hypothetical protein [Streptomyces sp. Root369]|uniref:hypothetical protein n=1 Tax=Streptomyces sp. Root369 TaxID=1736523 RepID=UPI000A549CAF|nr:hypothetical protein [Streptomyces sp. Root369]